MKVKCETCSKNIYRSAYRLRDYEHQYCSKLCADKGLLKPKTTVYCLQCDVKIEYLPSRDKYGGRKYCSTICANSHRSNPIIKNCLICSKEIKISKSQEKSGRGKYCSRSCASESQKGMKGNRSTTGYGVFKKHSKSLENKKCSLCNSSASIDLHHLDGDKFNNKTEENWMLICRKCHMRLHALVKKFQITHVKALETLKENKLWELSPYQFSNFAPED